MSSTAASPIPIPTPTVLLIDDDPSIHALVEVMLRPLRATVTAVSSGAEGLTLARASAPDVILLDNDMPDSTGLEVLSWINADPVLSAIPVIMETGSESNRTLAACFAAGAIDYVRKPFTASELRARVGSVLERQRMLSELASAARMDKLTGLANRALLHDRLTGALARAARDPDHAFALLFLDFDRFKLVNDTLGHEVGDMLLRGIADRLRGNLRASDTITRDSTGTTVARLGGDEFVVLLAGVSSAVTAAVVADRLLESLRLPYQLGPHTVRSSASIGMVYSTDGYSTADDMLRDADIAMYEAKARGKSCHVSFTQSMRDAISEKLSLENDLRDALGTEQVHVAFQPIVSLMDRSLRGVEALARWTHPTRGVVAPDVFIPIAEESRLILPLSDAILRAACEAFVRWKRESPDLAPAYMSVNLSRIQLGDPNVIERTIKTLSDTGMTASQLQLEVTESQIMQQRTIALGVLDTFRALGVRLAIDDFGTGYSSLSCLQEFPLDVLKIDRSFVANAKRGRDYAALLHSVVSLADNLGLEVVAEGIEEEAQLVLLQALGCGFGQGYLVARPMSADAMSGFMHSMAVAAAA